jgi:hypothetical protein
VNSSARRKSGKRSDQDKGLVPRGEKYEGEAERVGEDGCAAVVP